MNANKTEYICFECEGAISTQSGKPLKLIDKFIYLSSNILSTESDVNICLVKVWTAIDKLLIIWRSDLSDEKKWDFFQAYGLPKETVTAIMMLRWNKKDKFTHQMALH